MTLDNKLRVKSEPENLPATILFDDSALTELERMSGEYWPLAKVHARIAAANAGRAKKETVSRADVQAVDSPPAILEEAVRLALAGKDIGDEVLRRTLYQGDADRARKALDALRKGQLPEYALPHLATDDSTESERYKLIIVPFNALPSNVEVGVVASHFARFVTRVTREPQEVRESSRGRFGGVKWCLSPQEGDRYVNNYYVAGYFTYFNLERSEWKRQRDGGVTISRSDICRHEPNILRDYLTILGRK